VYGDNEKMKISRIKAMIGIGVGLVGGRISI